MKAAVMYQKGGMPEYTDFPEPVVKGEHELLVTVKAVAIKHLDKAKASGKHYSSAKDADAKVIGGDGVGLLEDGAPVYAVGISGTIAEKAVFDKNMMVRIPEGLDYAVAAALPNAIMGSAMGLRFKAGLRKGETVLINGATGFTGKIAVQVAKHYGAGKIIVTGRNETTLQSLRALGADETISLKQEDQALSAQLKEIHARTPVDVIIDYLWGHTAELIFASLRGSGSFTHNTRFVSVGAMAGDVISFSASNLRSVDLQLSGSGLGSWTKEEVQLLFREIIPEMFVLAAAGKLKADTVDVNLQDISTLWDMEAPGGKRLVVRI